MNLNDHPDAFSCRTRRRRVCRWAGILVAFAGLLHVGGMASAQNADDYLPRVVIYSDGRVTRFDRMPIRVRLGPVPIGMEDEGYRETFHEAAQLWTAATNGRVRFEFVESSQPDSEVDIPVFWVTKLPRRAMQNHLGITTLIRPTPETFRVRMQLSVYDRTTGRRLTKKEMLTVCLHEIGHALGLWGHSDQAEDVMSPASSAQRPTPRDVATLLRLYELPVNASLHKDAIAILQRQIQNNPTSAQLHFFLGSLLLDAKRYDEAIDALLRAVELDATLVEAGNKLVAAYIASGRTSAAVEHMETTGDSSPEFYNNAGIGLAEQGERAKAIEAFENALRLKPDFGAARRNLARLYADMALESVEKGDYARAEMPLKRAIALFPERTAFAVQLGVVLNRLGRDEEAILVYERVLAREPDSEDARVNLARTYNNLGVAKIDLGDWEGALADFDTALHYEPTLKLARDNRKTALWKWAEATKDSDPARSLKILQAYLRDDPNAVEAHVAAGILYAKYDDYVHAIEAFKRAYELDPSEQNRENLAITYHQNGTRLAQMGQNEAAIREFERGLELVPDNVNLLRSLGLAYRDAGQMEKAATTFQSIVERDPNDEWARQALVNLVLAAGNDAYKRRDYARAIAEFERVPPSSRTASVYGLLGYLYLETEQHEKAIDALGHALLLTPGDRTARTNIEFCTKQLKKELEAGGGPEISYALIRAESYQLAARIARRVHKADLGRFLKRLQQPGTDQETVRTLQDCALVIAQAAADSAPDEAREIVRAALSLNPYHVELKQWLEDHSP